MQFISSTLELSYFFCVRGWTGGKNKRYLGRVESLLIIRVVTFMRVTYPHILKLGLNRLNSMKNI